MKPVGPNSPKPQPAGSAKPTKPKASEPKAGVPPATTDSFAKDSGAIKQTSAVVGFAPVARAREVLAGAVKTSMQDDLPSVFPLDDLSKIPNHGRWGAGFRLDGGLVRLMWVQARRQKDTGGKQQYELFFFAQGKAIDMYKARLEKEGAKSQTFNFFGANLPSEGEPHEAVPSLTSSKWSPSAKATTLVAEGKYKVELLPASPEALKGACRITVQGDDAEATKTLNEVINKLGMQSVFAPPTPQSLERFKLMRFFWQVAPQELEKLKFKSVDSFDKKAVTAALEEAGLESDSLEMKSITSADLSDATLLRRISLAALLVDANPLGFVKWVNDQYQLTSGLVGGDNASNADSSLTSALKTAGIASDSDRYKAAEAATPDPMLAQKMLRLGLLARKKKAQAEKFLKADLDAVKTPQLHAALKDAGFDPADERFANMRFEQVYPGYFTVIDPKLAEEMAEAGARYLYSTADTAERVWSMLSGGQKSSFARFQEGVHVKGKSSSSDFGSGGAFSIFSRLVTKGAIDKARKGGGGSPTFHNWSGSRPYKVVINRSALGRLDWYGYNGDNYGRTTTLKPENRGEPIIKKINDSYSQTNEVMFAVGNDPAYIDFVVCENEAQKKKLVDLLKDKGVESFNGRPIEEFVRIETKFFLHPDDMTVEQAVEDAVGNLGFKDAKAKVAELCKEKGAGPAHDAAVSAAKAKANELAPEAATTAAKQGAKSAANKAGQSLVDKPEESLDLAELIAKLEAAAKPAAIEAAKLKGASAAAGASTWNVKNAVKGKIKKDKIVSAAKTATAGLAEAARDAVLAGAQPNWSLHQLRQKIRTAIREAVREPAMTAALAKATAMSKTIAYQEFEKVALSAAKNTGSWEAESAANKTLQLFAQGEEVAATKAAFVEAFTALVTEAASTAAKTAVQDKLPSAMKTKVRTAASEAALTAAKDASTAPGIELAKTLCNEAMKKTATEAVETFAKGQAEPLDDAKKAALVEDALKKAHELIEKTARDTVESSAKTVAKEATKKQGQEPEIADAAVAEVTPGLAEPTAAAVVPEVVKAQAEDAYRKMVSSLTSKIAKKAVKGIGEASIEGAKGAIPEASVKVHNQIAKSLAEDAVSSLLGKLEKLAGQINKVPKPKPVADPE